MVPTIYQQLSPAEVHGQLDRVVEQLREPFPQVAELLADAAPDILAFTAFPVAHWQKLWSNNPQERLPGVPSPQSLPPKGDVAGIFPNRLSARRLVGAVLAEQHDGGPKPAATSPSPTPPATRHCRRCRSGLINMVTRFYTLVCCSSPGSRSAGRARGARRSFWVSRHNPGLASWTRRSGAPNIQGLWHLQVWRTPGIIPLGG